MNINALGAPPGQWALLLLEELILSADDNDFAFAHPPPACPHLTAHGLEGGGGATFEP